MCTAAGTVSSRGQFEPLRRPPGAHTFQDTLREISARTPTGMTMTDTQTDQQRIVAWARVYAALKRSVSKGLRRGAWYPVLRNDLPDRVSIKMGTRTVDVPRRLVEVRPQRPVFFSVISRPEYRRDAGRSSVHNLGKTYVVCPECRHRFGLFGRPARKDCPGCGHKGEVGWWEA